MKKALMILSLPLTVLFFAALPAKAATPGYLQNPFQSSLKIIVNKDKPDTSDLNNVKIFEFQLDDKAPSPYEGTIYTHGPFEEIQVRRINFKVDGSIKDSDLSNIRLVNLDTGYVLQTLDNLKDKEFEFNLTINPSKPDFGVMVSWHKYAVFASINPPKHKRTVKAIIRSRNDIDAFDYRNDARVALISKKLNKFPLNGPNIRISP